MFSFVLILTIMNGFNKNIQSRFLDSKPHMMVTGDRASLDKFKKAVSPKLSDNDKIYNFETQDVVIKGYNGQLNGAIAQGLDSGALDAIKPLNGIDLADNEVVLGMALADKFGIFEGDELTLLPPEVILLPAGEVGSFANVIVKAIIDTDIEELDSQVIYYAYDKLSGLKDSKSRKLGFDFRLEKPKLADTYQSQWQSKYKSLNVQTWKDRDQSLFFALKLEKVIIGTIIAIATIITSFSIMTVLSLLLEQKRKEIANLRAIGLSIKDSYRIFSGVGFRLALLGLGGGFIFGIMVCAFLKVTDLKIMPEIYYDRSIPIDFDFKFLALTALIALLLAFIGSYLPVRMGIKKNIAETLK